MSPKPTTILRAVRIPALLGLLMMLLAASSPELRAQDESAGGATEAQAVVVPVQGEISIVTVRLIQRAIDRARSAGMSRVVLDIDTPGGAITVMREIESVLSALRSQARGGVRTTAFVRRWALSAGGYLALACDDTFMAPGATIGAITPVEVGPEGMRQIADDDARRKMLSAFRADVRSLVERRGGASSATLTIAEAMVDPTMRVFEINYVDRGGLETTTVVDETRLEELSANGARILSQQELGKTPLTLTADEALRWGISNGTYESIAELTREELLLTPSAVERLEPSWSESAVEWLEMMKPFLFVLGFLLLLLEVKVPGLIVPGALGVLLISLGLFSSDCSAAIWSASPTGPRSCCSSWDSG
jgi:membrane-bound serine protease (ClpP class)